MTAPKPRKEMLSRDYKAPKTPKGSHIELEGGRLISSATFSTSASKQEANADKRMASGSYFGQRVELVTPTADTSTERPPGTLQKPPTSVAYGKPYSLLDDRQRALHNLSLKDNGPTIHSVTPRQSKLTWGKG